VFPFGNFPYVYQFLTGPFAVRDKTVCFF
jgi:hypothetical protein